MKTRDFITLLGGICGALGPVFILASQNSALWWIGASLTAVSPVLISARSLIKEDGK